MQIIFLILKHILFIHAWTASGRANGSHFVINIHREEIRRIQLVDAASGCKVVIIVVENDDVLLICKKEDEQQIRQYVTDVQVEFGNKYV